MINRHGEYVCNCQWGYSGQDCANKMCPHGFDPITKDTQQEKKLRLSIVDTSPQSSGDKALPASVMLQFHGHVVEMEMQHLTADKCTQIFRRFRNLGELEVIDNFLDVH
ncbi:unnamed protein product [Aphanomyces euteiches]